MRAYFGFPELHARREIGLFGFSVRMTIGESHVQKMALGMYERGEAALLVREIRRGDRLLNIGANGGYYGFLGASKGVSVTLVEPIEELARMISGTLDQNGIRSATVVNCACSDSDGFLNFVCRSESGLSRVITEGGSLLPGEFARRVVAMRVDSMALERLDVVIIDCEGYGSAVLSGMETTLRCCRPRLIMIELVDDFLCRHGASVDTVVNRL